MEVTLIFKNIETLTEFLLTSQIPGLETNSKELTLKGSLSEKQMAYACATYGAVKAEPVLLYLDEEDFY